MGEHRLDRREKTGGTEKRKLQERGGQKQAAEEQAGGKQSFLPAFFIPRSARRGRREHRRGEGQAQGVGEAEQEGEKPQQESVERFFGFRSEEAVRRVKAPEKEGVIQVLRHKGEGEQEIRGQGQDQEGKDDMGGLLQDPAGQEEGGDQGRREKHRVEGGNQAKAEEGIGEEGEGGQEKGIKDGPAVNGLGQEGEGAVKEIAGKQEGGLLGEGEGEAVVKGEEDPGGGGNN